MSTSPSTSSAEPQLLERLRAATETLELVAADRSALALLSKTEHRRLRDAAAAVFNPDARARRTMSKALARRRQRERADRDDEVLAATGIRRRRPAPVVTTPNIFPPKAFEPRDIRPVDGESGWPEPDPSPETADPRHCYVCKRDYSAVHHFYDRLCPACGDFNFAKRTELADMRGRVALLSGGRVKIGYQAGLKLLRSGAQVSRRAGSCGAGRRASAARGRARRRP